MRRLSKFALLLIGILPTAVACWKTQGEKRLSPQYSRPPVVLISIDTLRADHLPAYGYKGVSTPRIDSLASQGIVFDNAWANVPLTLPSHVSILTGLLPFEHGVRNNIGYDFDASANTPIGRHLESLGYESGAAVSSYVLRRATGLGAAFDFYDDALDTDSTMPLGHLQRSGATTLTSAQRWISTRADRPFFFMLHLFEPHSPYSPPEPWGSLYKSSPYDGEIAAADELVGKFVEFLCSAGIYDRAVVILLSDHGEGLGDHGEDEHGIFLYREALHVPLIIKLPGGDRAGERVQSPVQLTDVANTLALVVGAKPLGRSPSLSLLDSRSLETPRHLYAETLYPRMHLGWSELRSLADDRFHYIDAPRPELYDLTTDPGETKNVLAAKRRNAARLREALAELPSQVTPMSSVSTEDASRLAALGYLGGTTGIGDELPDPKDFIDQFTRAKRAAALSDAGRFEEAVRMYREILAENPAFADVWSLLSATLERAGHPDEAIKALSAKMTRCPALRDETALSLADLLYRQGRLEEAESHADLVSERNSFGKHLVLGRIAAAREAWASAEAQAQAALRTEPDSLAAQVFLAGVVAKQGRSTEALARLDDIEHRANERQSNVEWLEFTRGEIYASLDMEAEAKEAFRREIDAYPSNLRAYCSLAILHFLGGDTQEMNSTLDEMQRANPGAPARDLARRTREAVSGAD